MGSRAVAAWIGGGGGGGDDGGGEPVGVDNRERSSQCENHGNRRFRELFGDGESKFFRLLLWGKIA